MKTSNIFKFIFCIAFLFFSKISIAQIAPSADKVRPLLIGAKMPSLELKNIDGKKVNAKDIFDKPSVVIFYRGGWCPFCNAHLSELQDIQSEIKSLGYKIIAISPDAAVKNEKTINKKSLSYELYSDDETSYIQAMGIAYKGGGLYRGLLKKRSEGLNKDGILPVPAVYIVNKKQKVLFSYVNPNFKERIESDILLAALKSMQ